MEQMKRNRFETVLDKVERSFIKDILGDISERSKILYRKHLRPTVNYDYLETKRIKERNLENILWEMIRSQ